MVHNNQGQAAKTSDLLGLLNPENEDTVVLQNVHY